MKKLPAQPRTTNRTGITGVSVANGFCHAYITGEDGKRISRKFSIGRYGSDEAFRLAVQWRRERELALHGSTVIPETLALKTGLHEQSEAEAADRKNLLKLAAVQTRQKKKQEFAVKKKRLQKGTGKYLYRIDNLDLGHGWLLRITINDEPLCDRIFRDGRYGSPEKALAAARKERDRQLRRHKVPYARGRKYSNALRSTNRTGITGVCRTDSFYYCYIPVKLRKTRTRKFSIAKYGERTAFLLAAEWRQRMELEVYGETILTDKKIRTVFKQTFG